MLRSIRQTLLQFPTPVAGLALGIAALGASWELLVPLQGQAQQAGAAAAALLLLLVLTKFSLNPLLLWRELAHPVVGGVVPTFSMGVMLVSKALYPFAPAPATGLWVLAVALHLSFLVLFALHRLRSFQLHHMAPSWFVPPVGIVTSALTCPPEALDLARHLMWFGLCNYCLLLPLMLYRLIFARRLPRAARPTLAILAAPANLCLAGYLTIVDQPSLLLVAMLGTLAQLMTLIVYLAFFQLLRLPFSPAYTAFTFPVVISSTAMLKLGELLARIGAPIDYTGPVQMLAKIELGAASLMVAYVALRFVLHYGGRLLKSRRPAPVCTELGNAQ